MGSVVISHLIGTVSLIVLFGIVATNFTIHYSFLQLEILAHNLQEISDYVSSEVSDLVSLSYLGTGDRLIFKELEVPESVNGQPYFLNITRSQNLIRVTAQPIRKDLMRSSYGEALLPWSAGGNIEIFNETDSVIQEHIRSFDPRVDPQTNVTSISKNLIVWCLKEGQKTTFGLGYLEEG